MTDQDLLIFDNNWWLTTILGLEIPTKSQYIHNEYKGTCFGSESRKILRNKNNGEITSSFFSEHVHVLLVLFSFHFRPKDVLIFAQHSVGFDLDED